MDGPDVQRGLVQLLARHSDLHASNQYRALQQFFRWLAGEEQLPHPMARLRAPKVTQKLVPVFTNGELSALERPARAARSPAPRCRGDRGAQGDRDPGRAW